MMFVGGIIGFSSIVVVRSQACHASDTKNTQEGQQRKYETPGTSSPWDAKEVPLYVLTNLTQCFENVPVHWVSVGWGTAGNVVPGRLGERYITRQLSLVADKVVIARATLASSSEPKLVVADGRHLLPTSSRMKSKKNPFHERSSQNQKQKKHCRWE